MGEKTVFLINRVITTVYQYLKKKNLNLYPICKNQLEIAHRPKHIRYNYET